MNILITGATGLIGRQLIKPLTAAGHTIHIVTRNAARVARQFPENVALCAWDAPHGEFPAEALEDADVLINLMGENVGAGRWTADRKRRIIESRVTGLQQIRACQERCRHTFKAVISASAVGLYGDRGDEILTRHTGPGRGFLADVCRQWEAAASSLRSERMVILRMGVVLSRSGGFLDRMLPLFRCGLGGPIGTGRQWLSWIHHSDLQHMILSAVTDPAWHGTYNAVAPAPVTNREFSETLAGALKRPCFLHAPALALRIALGEAASMALDSTRAVPDELPAGFRFQWPDIRAAIHNVIHEP